MGSKQHLDQAQISTQVHFWALWKLLSTFYSRLCRPGIFWVMQTTHFLTLMGNPYFYIGLELNIQHLLWQLFEPGPFAMSRVNPQSQTGRAEYSGLCRPAVFQVMQTTQNIPQKSPISPECCYLACIQHFEFHYQAIEAKLSPKEAVSEHFQKLISPFSQL